MNDMKWICNPCLGYPITWLNKKTILPCICCGKVIGFACYDLFWTNMRDDVIKTFVNCFVHVLVWILSCRSRSYQSCYLHMQAKLKRFSADQVCPTSPDGIATFIENIRAIRYKMGSTSFFPLSIWANNANQWRHKRLSTRLFQGLKCDGSLLLSIVP